MKCPKCGFLLEISAAAALRREQVRCRACGEAFAPITAPPPPPGQTPPPPGQTYSTSASPPLAPAPAAHAAETRSAAASKAGGGNDGQSAPPSISPSFTSAGHTLASLGHWARRAVKRPPPRPAGSPLENQERIWLLELSDGTRYGPVCQGELEEWVEEQRLTGDSLLSNDAGQNWYWACDVFPEHPFIFSSQEHESDSADPAEASAGITPARRWQALEWITGPAIGLILHGMLGIVLHGVWLAFILWAAYGRATAGEWQAAWLELNRAMTPVVPIAVGGVTIFASLRLLRLEGYHWGLAVAWISLVPCLSPCCLSGLPLGCWMLLVLSLTTVREAILENQLAAEESA